MKKLIYLLIMVMLLSGCAHQKELTINEKSTLDSSIGKTYYTLTNIWFPRLNRASSNNIKKRSNILPAGTKVKIICFKGLDIEFSDDLGVVYGFRLERKNTIDLVTFFTRHFSKENIMAEGEMFSKFTKQERENIKNNTIDYGMSKEAVLMSYGYPPSERYIFPNITVNKWVYIIGKKRTTNVYFDDNKVVRIEDVKQKYHAPLHEGGERVLIRKPKDQTDILKQNTTSADEILKYKKLLDSGAITKAEYEQKKNQLLGL